MLRCYSKILLNIIACLSAFLLLSHVVFADTKDKDDVVGFWYTQDRDGIIELYSCDLQICGRFYWVKYDEKKGVPRDHENPDPLKRDTPLCMMQFMGGVTIDGQKQYSHGWIYNPEDGQIYGARMTLVDNNTLDLHGYILHPIFGSNQVWTRTQPKQTCGAFVQ